MITSFLFIKSNFCQRNNVQSNSRAPGIPEVLKMFLLQISFFHHGGNNFLLWMDKLEPFPLLVNDATGTDTTDTRMVRRQVDWQSYI